MIHLKGGYLVDPVNRLDGPGDLWIEFPFPPEYLVVIPAEGGELVGGKTSVKVSVKTSVKILQILGDHPEMTLAQVVVEVGKTLRAVELASSKLVKAGRSRYVGPQKGGHWEVLK
jgi:ATP-dependent DNA helicase RecG